MEAPELTQDQKDTFNFITNGKDVVLMSGFVSGKPRSIICATQIVEGKVRIYPLAMLLEDDDCDLKDCFGDKIIEEEPAK